MRLGCVAIALCFLCVLRVFSGNRWLSYPRLKNCTARSCFSAAFLVENVPRFLRRPVFGFFLREYSLYSPDFSLRIMTLGWHQAADRNPLSTTTANVMNSYRIPSIPSALPARYAEKTEVDMPEKETLERAHEDAREGKSPSTQAGEFVREEMHHIREGKHGASSTKQAIAIGLSKARRSGIKLAAPRKGTVSAKTRKQATRDTRKGQSGSRHKTSATRSRAVRGALKRKGRSAASPTALSRQAHATAARRGATARHRSAMKAVRTKGTRGRSQAAQKAARTRRAHSRG